MSIKIKLGISIGDINGIGTEVILKTFRDKRMLDFCTPVIFGDFNMMNELKKRLHFDDLYLNKIQSIEMAKGNTINVINCWKEEVKLNLGQNNSDGGKYALKSLQAANTALKNGQLDALVTAPINKDNIQSDDFKFPGHTEFLEKEHKGKSLMLMLSDNLRIGVVTGHIPLEKVSEHISTDSILDKLNTLNQSLKQDFGIRKPKIAVLGLNPHAGDNGVIGNEEKKTIIPALKKAEEQNILAFGPYPADGFFGSNKRQAFDGILAMYHDQGLVPFKTLSFGNGVNFTAGLDIVRTSPDHGTAFDIAGKNQAQESSFRQAVYTACDVSKKRKEWQELNSNPLKISAKKEHSRSKVE